MSSVAVPRASYPNRPLAADLPGDAMFVALPRIVEPPEGTMDTTRTASPVWTVLGVGADRGRPPALLASPMVVAAPRA
ncbi:hypothetical protein [Actinophytocola oryzae]|nr:hypothetical protein [Actinophytocola oryzae]